LNIDSDSDRFDGASSKEGHMAVEVRTSAVVVDTRQSPFAMMRPLAVGDVKLADTIWEPRRRMTAEHTVPEQHTLLESSQRLDNFRRAAGTLDGQFFGRYFNDTDVYKWLEAAAWTLANEFNAELDALVDSVIETVGAAQLPDGYLDNFYVVDQLDKRWTNLTVTHELYCAGHLFQAAVAHFRATGKESLLNIACKFADLICDTFGPAEDGRAGTRDRQPALHRPGALFPQCTRIRPGGRRRVPPGPPAVPGDYDGRWARSASGLLHRRRGRHLHRDGR
jgi:hypothetical protein